MTKVTLTTVRILVYPADNFLGSVLCRYWIRNGYRNKEQKIVAAVYDIRSPTSHILVTLGVKVIEIPPGRQEELVNIVAEVAGVVLIPSMENSPMWNSLFISTVNALRQIKQRHLVMISSLGVEHIDSNKKEPHIMWELKRCEEEFLTLSKNEEGSWHGQPSIIRCSLGQEVLLLFSRLIQETGTLSWPVEKNSKCSFVSGEDLAIGVNMLLTQSQKKQDEVQNPIYRFTGPDSQSMSQLVSLIKEQSGILLELHPLEPQFTFRYLMDECGSTATAFAEYYVSMLYLLKRGKLDTVTEDVGSLIDQSPKSLQQFLTENKAQFRS